MKIAGVLRKIVFSAAVAYVALCGGLYLLQAKFIFFPDPTPAGEPDDPRMSLINVVETTEEAGWIAWYAEASPSCPTMILFHGNASHIARDPWRYQRVLDKGVGLLAVAWPGYAGSPGAPGESAFHDVANSAESWLENEGVDRSDIVIHAFSIGTGAATKLASEGDYGALVLEAPYYSLLDLVGEKMPTLPVGLLLKNTFRTDEWIGDIRFPVFVAHGTADSVIPQTQSRRLFELVDAPKSYESFEGSEHATLVRDGLYDRLWPFLQPIYPDCSLTQTDEVTST